MAEAGEYSLGDYLHRLPQARIVDRVDWLAERCQNRRVVHVGFADSGAVARRTRAAKWLHGHLAAGAADLVGIDSDSTAVAAAARDGYKVHAADCADPAAIAALGLEPADIVVAGEMIQSVEQLGSLLKGLRQLCRQDGELVITAHNAYGLMYTAAATLRGVELQDPNHVTTFTWRTLTELVRRNGWHVVETATYIASLTGREDRSRLELASIRAVLEIERILGWLGRPFAADGLIVVAEPA